MGSSVHYERDVDAAIAIAEETAKHYRWMSPLQAARRAVADVENERCVYEPMHSRSLAAFREAVEELERRESRPQAPVAGAERGGRNPNCGAGEGAL